jgi:DNA-binding transcriptional LysR family regulator
MLPTPFGLCPSGVSAGVNTLQKDLGVGLFKRHACGVTLAEAGEPDLFSIGASQA